MFDLQDWFRRLFMRGKYDDEQYWFFIDPVEGQKLYNAGQRERMGAGIPVGRTTHPTGWCAMCLFGWSCNLYVGCVILPSYIFDV